MIVTRNRQAVAIKLSKAYERYTMIYNENISRRPPWRTGRELTLADSRKYFGLPPCAEGDLLSYLNTVESIPRLVPREEIALGWKAIYEGCPVCVATLARSHLYLVLSIAKCYVGRGLPYEKLILEGNLGLLDAVKDFDPAEVNRFSSRASWWIRQGIRWALMNAPAMRRLTK